MDQGGKPSLDSLATEIQLQILRYILRAPIIELSPLDSYSSHKFGLGSLGILRVSKHFSALALGVLYGENTFYAEASRFDIQREADVPKVKEVYGHIEPFSNKDLKLSRWSNLKGIPEEELATVSSVECLDLISQTTPGQQRLKRVHMCLGCVHVLRFMDGVLPQILQRMRGLQSLKMELNKARGDWYDLIPDTPSGYDFDDDKWASQYARHFLLVVKNELTHIKTITLYRCGKEHAPRWMKRQLQKRNAAWIPPAPAYMNFRRTTSNAAVFDLDVNEANAQRVEDFKPGQDETSMSYMEKKFGVF